jgi:GNAT superfamily N-acetyltransferase
MGIGHGTAGVTVRPLTAGDIPGAMRLKDAAGWNQTEADWRNVMSIEPEGCFGIECDGDLRATVTAVSFGPELAWIGMMLTDAAYRGRGLARCLMEQAIDHLKRRNAGWIKLDATDMGRPVYQRFGFQDEAPVERWIRKPRPVPPDRKQAGPYKANVALDREAFGADRSQLLRVLAGMESASIGDAGFAMGRAGSRAAYFGPCVARSVDVARDLLGWFLNRHGKESVYWDILPANREAVRMAREFGFEPVRQLVRMTLAAAPGAPPLRHEDALVFAIAGFEYG